MLRRLADKAEDIDLWLSLVTPEQARSPDIAADIIAISDNGNRALAKG